MENNTARLFSCAKCQDQVIICSYCDRGNIYCQCCSKSARKISIRTANARYQQTFKGKLKHANRQKAYRLRKKQKVTDHGSIVESSNDVLTKEGNKSLAVIKNSVNSILKQNLICNCCGKRCNPLLRSNFIGDRNSKALLPLIIN